ncbi:MAG: GNAT family N-acetyltransferase [Deltaproteobacteria bacterium]|nr:GNAT family N-acetyltransferase [Candidatus Anaeroferrophillus wilburensis]MBN2889185.1 GNAT family N-acetyltransferase [Deltaproteobacteria bacterium]
MTVEAGYVPGLIGRVVAMHADYYHQHWGFGSYFEAKVAAGLGEFVGRFDQERDALWSVVQNGSVEACLAIDGLRAVEQGAHLRWFIVSDTLRGHGMGWLLLQRAMEFCDRKGYQSLYLWTFAGLDAARHLYEKAGFRLVEECWGEQWGTKVMEQRFVRQAGQGLGCLPPV